MTTFFLTCAALGGGILVVQLILGLAGVAHIGADGHVHVGGDSGNDSTSEGLHLLTVRAIAAGLAFFGLGGLAGLSTGFGLFAALPLGLLLGGAAMVGTAAITRWMLSMDDDGTVSIHGAVGVTGTVYLPIPGERAGAGKVLLTLQNRTVEYQAVTSTGPLPMGATILVVDVVNNDTVDVVPDPTTKELSNVVR
jgi:hypothetical protein